MRREHLFTALLSLFPVYVLLGQTFTLEDVLSAPMPSSMVAAPNGGQVAWVQNDRGVRNIWLADGPDYQGRQVTAFDNDDGQGLGSLRFTLNGKGLVYVRGGSPNRSGELPNPESITRGVERAIYLFDLAKGQSRKLTDGASPTLTPDGASLIYASRGQVFSVPLKSRKKKWGRKGGDSEPETLFKIRGSVSGLTWSPDGSLLAFSNRREGHGFVVVFNPAEESLTFMAPSVDRDTRPTWSPDSRQIAFIRLAANNDRIPFTPQREGEPWSIWIADVATGKGWQVWRADEGPGSVFRTAEGSDQLYWAAGDMLAFPWEKNGWLNLYVVSSAGGEARPLTPGEFEVMHIELTPDRKRLVFASNQADINLRHLWEVPVSGGGATALTSGATNAWSPTPSADGRALVFLGSTATAPAHARVLVGGENRPVAPGTVPANFPSDRLITPQAVIFKASDGMDVPGQLFLPPDLAAGEKRPALIFTHGGSRRQMLLGFHYSGYYHNAYSLNQYMASRGYVVLSVNYRSGIGYGLNFREALDYGAQGGSEYNDVQGAGHYLASRPDVDPRAIGLWGGSYGGYLTALGLARDSDLFAAGVDFHGVHDWNVVIGNFLPTYDPIELAAFAEVAFKASPMADIDTWRSPVLLIHGDDDRNVQFSETIDLVEALRERSVHVEQLIFPDEVHGFLLYRRWLQAYQATAEFFKAQLGR